MRKETLLVRRIALAVGILALAYASTYVLRNRGRQSALRTVEQVYRLVLQGDYGALQTKELATPSAVMTLKEAERLHGKLTGWRLVKAETQLLGRPTKVDIRVDRGGKSYMNVLALGDSVHVHILIELDERHWRSGRFDGAVRVIGPKPGDPNRP